MPTDRLVKRRNQQVVLECVVQSNPMETYYLEHHSIRVHSSERRRLEDTSSSRSDVRTLRLIIPSLSTKDFGHYKCVAINNLGRSEASIFLSGKLFISNLYSETLSLLDFCQVTDDLNFSKVVCCTNITQILFT